MGKVKKANASNPRSHQKWQLNSSKELQKLQQAVFQKLPETKEAFTKSETAISNLANMGLVYRLDDKQRSLMNHKTSVEVAKKLGKEQPAPIELKVPEEMGKKEVYMMHEWDYDYCAPLVTAYGTNYKAMSRDKKRNYRQKSEAQLRKLCEDYIAFTSYGEKKLDEYTKLDEELTKKERQGTILGAPEAILSATTPMTDDTAPTTTQDNSTKRKREDDKGEEAKDTTTEANGAKQRKVTKKTTEETTEKPKQPEKAKANGKATEKPTKETTKEAPTKAKATPTKKEAAKKEPATKAPATPTPTPKTTKSKETPKETPATTTTTATKKQPAKTKETPKETTKEKPTTAKKGKEEKKTTKQAVMDSDDSDLEGMEFDFNEDDLSSDDE